MNEALGATLGHAPSRRGSLRGERASFAFAAAAFVFALVIHALRPGVTDVSWLLVVGERILDGDRLYVDLFEVNPPASYLLYLPAVWLGRVTGVAAEWFVLAMTALAFVGSAAAAGAMLRAAGLLRRPGVAAIAAVVAFLLLPGDSFAQREHFALLLTSPAVALAMRRLHGAAEMAAWRNALVGVAAGCAVCIKPQFALALLLPQAFVAWRAWSLRPLLRADNWTTLGVVALYVALTAIRFPAFWSEMAPLVMQAYRPVRQPLWILALVMAPVLIPAFLYATLRPGLLREAAAPLLAALGFTIAFLEQGKGWPYHFLPAAGLFLFVVVQDALLCALDERRPLARILPVVLAALLATFALFRFHGINDATRDVEAAVRATAAHPRILTLTGDISLGHPLTRRVGGQWVGATPSQWITANVRRMAEGDPTAPRRLAALTALDRALFLRGLERAPDALLVDRRGGAASWLAWAREDEKVARLLDDYVLEQSGAFVDLYVRR